MRAASTVSLVQVTGSNLTYAYIVLAISLGALAIAYALRAQVLEKHILGVLAQVLVMHPLYHPILILLLPLTMSLKSLMMQVVFLMTH